MKKLTVQIIAAEKPTYWYADRIGQQIEVFDFNGNYIVAADYELHRTFTYIEKTDALPVVSTPPQPRKGGISNTLLVVLVVLAVAAITVSLLVGG